MTITFVGHGYVGLVTACVFSDFGNKVWVIGRTPEKLERLKKGDPIIYEPRLEELLKKNLSAKRLLFTTDYDKAIVQSDIVFIAVGTPEKETGEADLTNVFDVAKKIAAHLKDGETLVACKSTVPVGTNKKIEKIILDNKPEKAQFLIASCPEFLREGSAISDTTHPDRVVIGAESKRAVDLLLKLHQPIQGKRVITNLASAELVKYAANSMLATKISFANLLSFFSEKTGADVEQVLDAVGLDRRIGRIFLNPGIGFGGSCLPKDVVALIQTGKNLNIPMSLLQSVDEVNELAKKNFMEKVLAHTKGKKIAVWGLSFKPNTDDIRDAPSLFVLKTLLEKGYNLSVFDPAAMENVRKIFGEKISYGDDPYSVLDQVDALCILTEWNDFKQIDLGRVKKMMKTPLLFDGRNIYDPQEMKNLGFTYFSVGR